MWKFEQKNSKESNEMKIWNYVFGWKLLFFMSNVCALAYFFFFFVIKNAKYCIFMTFCGQQVNQPYIFFHVFLDISLYYKMNQIKLLCISKEMCFMLIFFGFFTAQKWDRQKKNQKNVGCIFWLKIECLFYLHSIVFVVSF